MKLPAEVTIYEVGPRDGLQNEARNVPTADKIRFIDALVASGIRSIEITSFVSPKWIPQLADSSEVARGVQRPAGSARARSSAHRRGAAHRARPPTSRRAAGSTSVTRSS